MWLIKLLSYQYGHLLRAFELTYHTIGFTIGRLEVPQTAQDHIFGDHLSMGTGSGGPEVRGSNEFGTK